jgi:hypothetical protein
MSNTNESKEIEKTKSDNAVGPELYLPSFTQDELLRSTSQVYRTSSKCDREANDSIYSCHYDYAQFESQQTGQDFHKVMTRICPEWEEDKWKSVVPEEKDLQVGDIIETKNIFVYCNSVLKSMYNDTIGVFFDKDNNDYVTYNATKSQFMEHSGDRHITYGLRHEVKFDKKDIEGKVGYIISAPWVASKSKPIAELAETRPIFEVCTEDDGVLKRFIIPQDFSIGGNKTACVNAEITYNNDLWKVVIKREFVNGFADDMRTLINDLRKMSGLGELDVNMESNNFYENSY